MVCSGSRAMVCSAAWLSRPTRLPPRLGEAACGDRTYAGARAGDDCDLVGEVERGLLQLFVARSRTLDPGAFAVRKGLQRLHGH
jgi:hypothetical protein